MEGVFGHSLFSNWSLCAIKTICFMNCGNVASGSYDAELQFVCAPLHPVFGVSAKRLSCPVWELLRKERSRHKPVL